VCLLGRRRAEKRCARKAAGRKGSGSSSDGDEDDGDVRAANGQRKGSGAQKQLLERQQLPRGAVVADEEDPFNDPFFQVKVLEVDCLMQDEHRWVLC